MPAIPEVIETFYNLAKLHEKKNNDYSSQDNPFENFERSELIMSWFKKDFDKPFVNQIANKIARLANLLSNDMFPNNESIEDSFDDIIVYTALWKARHQRRLNKLP